MASRQIVSKDFAWGGETGNEDVGMADAVTKDQAAAATDADDLSLELGFFDRQGSASDHPVSFDVEASEEPVDFESREERRGRFVRMVGGVVGLLSVLALLGVARPSPKPPEAPPVAAFSEPAAEAAAPAAPTTEIVEFEPIAATPDMASAEPSATSKLSAAEPLASTAPVASVAVSKRRGARPAAAAPVRAVSTPTVATPPVLPAANGLAPTARFAD